MDLGYARITTPKQELARQIDALTKAGINPPANVYADKKSGATTERPELQLRSNGRCDRGAHPRPAAAPSASRGGSRTGLAAIATRGRSTASEPSRHE
ncbi:MULTISPECIES: recombinase family protein [Rhodococcus]|uniref:Resolvase/invertase-type recombinase catalytic domain-containing protein n=2 Tax=Rhodococcus opacus TaxID=37919 RepID=C1BCB4_RHOOB|nr:MULTISPECIES: recombinase family protein [Rhodococcus]EID80053.1 hypothetical protein W59_10334 [Rhodococcus opacus RKJ300 = JCM 13270]BAH55969.1 hypothetical protein ROP_pROB01-04700 [Rhodococcus opacus B4]